jgi:hypothetical protein
MYSGFLLKSGFEMLMQNAGNQTSDIKIPYEALKYKEYGNCLTQDHQPLRVQFDKNE